MESQFLDPTKLYIPNPDGSVKRVIERPWFIPSKESLDEQQNLLKSLFFLVRQGDAFGERLRCVRCNSRHDYITLMCVERPFSGLTRGLYAYYQAITQNNLVGNLSPQERARYNAIYNALSSDVSLDLAKSHPQMARQVTKGLGPSDMMMGAISFGLLEGIPKTYAMRLVDKINGRGLKPKLVLEQ